MNPASYLSGRAQYRPPHQVQLDVVQALALRQVVVVSGRQQTRPVPPHDRICNTKRSPLRDRKWEVAAVKFGLGARSGAKGAIRIDTRAAPAKPSLMLKVSISMPAMLPDSRQRLLYDLRDSGFPRC